MLSEYSKAEAVCLQMLEDRDALERDEYVSIDKVWQTLGKIYRKQKSYDKAEQVLLQALPRRRNAYGENSRVCHDHFLYYFAIDLTKSKISLPSSGERTIPETLSNQMSMGRSFWMSTIKRAHSR